MNIRTVLGVIFLLSCIGVIEAGDAIVDGIFVAGDEPQLICSLSGFRTSDLPAKDDDGAVLGLGDIRFDVVLSDEARKLGVRPGALRLMRMNPPNQRNLGKIVALSYELDRGDKNLFHMATHRQLEPGRYHFCVEKADFSTGKPEMTVKMIFFECSFVVIDFGDLEAN